MAVLTDLFTALVRSVPAASRALDVAVEDGRVVGAAFWQAPRPHAGGALAFLRQVPAFLRTLGVGGALRAVRHLGRMDRAVRRRRTGTSPRSVSRRSPGAGGVGGLLLEHALDRVDGRGEDAYLESSTPQNRRLYRRHGFGEGAPITGLGAARPVSMWRPAATATR